MGSFRKNSKHEFPTASWKDRLIGKTRKGKVLRLSGALVAMGGAAIAAIIVFAGITGYISIAESPTVQWTEMNKDSFGLRPPLVVGTDGSGITGTVALSGAESTTDNLALTVGNALPGSWITFGSQVTTNNDGLVLQSIDIPGVEVTIAEGATVNDIPAIGCGDPVRENGGTAGESGDINARVAFKVTIPVGAVPGQITIPETAGLTAVPAAQYVAADCNPATP